MSLVVVTGADRGIGAALVQVYRQRGDTAIAACLGTGERHADSGIEIAAGVDVTRRESFAALVERLDGRQVDVLVCNAGIFVPGGFDDPDYDQMMRQFDVNALGAMRAVHALRQHIPRGGRIGIVTSRVGSLGENGSGGLYGYRMSKCAANMLGVNLHHDLAPRGIGVMLLHPGQVLTEMARGFEDQGDFIQPDVAARGLVAQLDALDPSRAPEFRHADGTLLPW